VLKHSVTVWSASDAHCASTKFRLGKSFLVGRRVHSGRGGRRLALPPPTGQGGYGGAGDRGAGHHGIRMWLA